MANNALTRKLLKQLGLEYGPDDSTDPEVLRIRRLYSKFLLINIERSAEDLNKELREMLIMADQAKIEAYHFLSTNGLTATELGSSWNEHFMCLEIKLKIDGEPIATQAEHYLSYEDREIQIRVMSSSSNNNFNPDDMLKMFEAKQKAALDLNPRINTKFSELEAELEQLMRKFDPAKLALILPTLIKINQKLVCLLAVELIRKDLEYYDYNPTAEQISNKIAAIEKQETANISKTRRAIKIVGYPQITGDDGDYSQWMLTNNVPKSDISSDERELHVRRVPNAWDVTQSVCTIANGKLRTVIKHAEAYRSASVAQLKEFEIVRGPGSDEYNNLRNLVVETARDQIIEKLNNNHEIDWSQIFSVQTLYITLLTPLKSKEASSRSLLVKHLAPKKIRDTLLKGNEDEQLISLRTALLQIDGKELHFSAFDIQFIIDHLPADAGPEVKEHLSSLTIQHDFFYSNFSVNTAKKIDLGSFKECIKNNELHNTKGVEYLDKHLIKFLSNKGFDLAAILYLPNPNPDIKLKKDWIKIKDELKSKLATMNPSSVIYKTLNLYLQLGDYFESQEDRKFQYTHLISSPRAKDENSMLVESYFAATIEVQLASLLGFDIRTTCKSGKDRTGLFLAILEASAGPPEKFRINLCRALKYSDIKELIEQNRAGCRGVQIDADVMDGLVQYAGVPLEGEPNEFKNLLTLWESRDVGSIPKKVYNKNREVVDEYVKNHPPTPGHIPLKISSPIMATKPPPPIVPKRPTNLTFADKKTVHQPSDPQPIIISKQNQPPLPPKKVEQYKIKLKASEQKAKPKTIDKPVDPDQLTFNQKLKLFRDQDKGHHGPSKHE